MRSAVLLLAVLFNLYSPLSAQSPDWLEFFDGAGHNNDEARRVVYDADGSVYIAGGTYGAGTNEDFTVVKYDMAGNLAWSSTFNGPQNYPDIPFGLWVDGSGGVAATGSSYYLPFVRSFFTTSYAADGQVLWQSVHDTVSGNESEGKATVMDGNGNTFATGWVKGGGSDPSDILTIKYDASGTIAATDVVNGGGSYDEGQVIAADASGDIYVAASSYRNSSFGT